MVYRLYTSDSGLTWGADQLEHFVWFEQYGDKYSPEPSIPIPTYKSGYLPRYQKRQIIGYYVASGGGDLRPIEVNASGAIKADVEVEVSSGLFVNISGQGILISGQHVYIESGAHVIADITVEVSSGLWVSLPGTQVSGTVQVSGTISIASGAQVITQLGIQVSGAVIISGTASISGNYITIDSGLEIIWRGVQVSGFVGVLSGEFHILSGQVSIQSGAQVVTQPIGQISGTVIVASGAEVVWRGVQVSGTVQISGSFSISGNVVTISGNVVSVASGIWGTIGVISGAFVNISGQYVNWVQTSGLVTILSGAVGITSGSVRVSGTVEVSGRVSVLSGLVGILSGSVGAQVSGAVMISGQVYMTSGMVAVLSGHVSILSGIVDVSTPTNILVNVTVNPQVIGNNSGGDIITSNAIKSVILKSVAANSGMFYLGGYAVGHLPYSGAGFVLDPGEAVNIDISQLGYIRVFACVSGDLLTYIANV